MDSPFSRLRWGDSVRQHPEGRIITFKSTSAWTGLCFLPPKILARIAGAAEMEGRLEKQALQVTGPAGIHQPNTDYCSLGLSWRWQILSSLRFAAWRRSRTAHCHNKSLSFSKWGLNTLGLSHILASAKGDVTSLGFIEGAGRIAKEVSPCGGTAIRSYLLAPGTSVIK